MKHRRKAFRALLAIPLVLLMLPSAAQAAQINDVCNVYGRQPVFNVAGIGMILYWLDPNAGFRITGFDGGYYRGHGNARAEGFIWRDVIIQETCHP